MKVLLMNTPDAHVGKTTSDWDLEASDIGVFPPVGLMYLAGAVRAKGRHQVKITDTILNKMTVDDILREIREYDPAIVGLTVYTPTLYDTFMVSEAIRREFPSKTIVWGGPHTIEFPDECIERKDLVDYIVRGEAEDTFPQLLDALADGRSPKGITGVCFMENGTQVKSADVGYIKDIDSTPFPAFDLVEFRRYFSAIGTGQPVGTICTSRGCPFLCTYCAVPYKTYRSRSVENIIAEMRVYYDQGIREFFFFDDLFNANVRRFKAVAEGILATGWNIIWSFRGRVDAINDEVIALAKKSGLRQALFGVEAATDEGLKEIKKKIKMEQVYNAIRICKKHGVLSSTNWIIGFPHHKTRKDVLDLIETAVKVDSDFAQFNICIAYNGTEIFSQGVSEGLFDKDIWKNYAKNPQPHFVEPIWDKNLSREELSELLKKCYHSFYFRPKFIWRKLIRIRSIGEFNLHVKGALTLLGVGGYHRKKNASEE